MLENILESCKYVSVNSENVKINKDKLKKFTREISNTKIEHWLAFSPYGLLDLPINTLINFLLIYDSINFSFWGNPKWTIEANCRQEDGSIALLYALLEYVKENNTTDFSEMTKDQWAYILKGNIEIPLIEKRLEIVKNVSNIVNEKMDGDFYKYIKNITTDTELFDIIVNNFKSFKDERTYKGRTIYFYKLAQLLTSDILHITEIIEKKKMDYSHLVGCSDYKIPQVMRALEILEYSDDLSNIVDNKKEIKENTEYEVEIRANMIVAIDLIKKELNNKVSAIDINDYIWNQVRNKNIKLKPYHLTRTTNY